MADFIDEQIAIISKNISIAEKPRENLKSLKKLLQAQKVLLKEYSVVFEGMDYDSRQYFKTSLELPVEATEYAINVLEGDDDRSLGFYDEQNDEALARIIEKYGFDTFLDPRVLEVMSKFVFVSRNLSETHNLVSNVRFIPDNASCISLDFYRQTINLKLPHDLEVLDEHFMSEVITHTIPFLDWFKKTTGIAFAQTSGYNGSYSAKIILGDNGDGVIWKTNITPHNRRFKELYPEDSTFESFTELITHLVEVNEKVKLASR